MGKLLAAVVMLGAISASPLDFRDIANGNPVGQGEWGYSDQVSKRDLTRFRTNRSFRRPFHFSAVLLCYLDHDRLVVRWYRQFARLRGRQRRERALRADEGWRIDLGRSGAYRAKSSRPCCLRRARARQIRPCVLHL